jgi:hypothetical protein
MEVLRLLAPKDWQFRGGVTVVENVTVVVSYFISSMARHVRDATGAGVRSFGVRQLAATFHPVSVRAGISTEDTTLLMRRPLGRHVLS